jgi:hypothetical protein
VLRREYLLFSPVGVSAIAILVLNDACFKLWAGAGPWAPVTGKLSGIAGVVVLPALLEVMAASVLPRRMAASLAVAVTGVAFVLLETYPPFVHAYTSANQTVYDALGLGWRAMATMDPTDLAVLPFLAVTYGGLKRYATHRKAL